MANTGYRNGWESVPMSNRIEDRRSRPIGTPEQQQALRDAGDRFSRGELDEKGYLDIAQPIDRAMSNQLQPNPVGRLWDTVATSWNNIGQAYFSPAPDPNNQVARDAGAFDIDNVPRYTPPDTAEPDPYSDPFLTPPDETGFQPGYDSNQGYDEAGFEEQPYESSQGYDEVAFEDPNESYASANDGDETDFQNELNSSSYDEAGFEGGEEAGYEEGGEVEGDDWEPYQEAAAAPEEPEPAPAPEPPPEPEPEPEPTPEPKQYAQLAVGTGTATDAGPEDDWEPYVEPAAPAAAGAKPAVAAAPKDDWEPYVEPEGMLGTFTRELIHGAPTAVAGAVTGAGAGAALGAAGMNPVTVIGGTLAGAVVGGYTAEAAKDKSLKALGYDDDIQRAANVKANPWSAAAGTALSNVAGGAAGLGKAAVAAGARYLGAGIGGAWETGSQVYQGKSLKEAIPPIVASTVGGAVFAGGRPWTRGAERVGANIGERFKPAPPPPPPIPPAAPPPAQGQFPGVGGGERQPQLPLEPPPPPRARSEPQLPLEPPPTVNAEGQLGFSINAPHTDSRYAAQASRDSQPAAAGTAREAAPPSPLPKEPDPYPHSAVRRGMMADAGGAQPDAASGIHVLQPGQMDPTIQHGLRVHTGQPEPPPQPQTKFEPPRPPDGSLPGGRWEPLPPSRSVVPHISESTQGVSEPPVPGGHTRMYQGYGQPPRLFTTDRAIAQRFGKVRYTDVNNETGMQYFKPGRQAGEFVTDNPNFQRRTQPPGQIKTHPQGEPITPPPPAVPPPAPSPAGGPPPVPRMSTPEIDAAVTRAVGPGAAAAPAQVARPAAPVVRQATLTTKAGSRQVRVSPEPARTGKDGKSYQKVTYKGKDYYVPAEQLTVKEPPKQPTARTVEAEGKSARMAREGQKTFPAEPTAEMHPAAREVMALAKQIEATGRPEAAGFANSMRAAAHNNMIRPDQDLKFYHQKLADFQARAGAEAGGEKPSENYSARNMLDEKQNAQLDAILGDRKTVATNNLARLLDMAVERSKALGEEINAAGWRIADVHGSEKTIPAEVRLAKEQLSAIGGTISRALAGMKPRKGKDIEARAAADAKNLRAMLANWKPETKIAREPEPKVESTPESAAYVEAASQRAHARIQEEVAARSGPIDPVLANRMLNQPAVLNSEAAKRHLTPQELKEKALEAVKPKAVETPATPHEGDVFHPGEQIPGYPRFPTAEEHAAARAEPSVTHPRLAAAIERINANRARLQEEASKPFGTRISPEVHEGEIIPPLPKVKRQSQAAKDRAAEDAAYSERHWQRAKEKEPNLTREEFERRGFQAMGQAFLTGKFDPTVQPAAAPAKPSGVAYNTSSPEGRAAKAYADANPEPAGRPPGDFIGAVRDDISASDYARELSRLQGQRPRPFNKLWNNPDKAPPGAAERHQEQVKAFNKQYRAVDKNHKLALDRDNEAFRARQEEPKRLPTAEQTSAAQQEAREQAAWKDLVQSLKGEEPGARTAKEVGYLESRLEFLERRLEKSKAANDAPEIAAWEKSIAATTKRLEATRALAPKEEPAFPKPGDDLEIPDFLKRTPTKEAMIRPGAERVEPGTKVERTRRSELPELPIGTEQKILEKGLEKATGPKLPPREPYMEGATRTGPPAGKQKVKTNDGAVFTGATIHEAALFARNAGYKQNQIFDMSGNAYTPPKAAPPPVAARAAPAAATVPPGGGRTPPTPPPTSLAAAHEAILSKVAEKPPWYSKLPTTKAEAKSAWREFYTGLKNAMDPIEQARKLSDRKLSPEEDFAMLARLTKGLGGRFQQMIKHGTYDIETGKVNGKGLDEIIKPIADNPKEFTSYALSKRTIELEGRDIKTGMDLQAARRVVAEEAHRFEPVFRELHAFQDRVLENLVKTGVISHTVATKMRALNKEYVPFYRLLDPNSELGQQLGSGLQTRNPVFKIKGSDKDVHDPIDSIIKNTYVFTDLAHRNQALVAMKAFNNSLPDGKQFMVRDRSTHPIEVSTGELQRWMDKHGIEGFADEAMTIFRPNAFRPDENTIRLFNNGKAEIYKVNPEIGNAVNAMDKQSQELWLKILSSPAKLLRAGAVLSPEFMLRNPLRDMLTAFVQAKHGSIPVYDFAVGLKALFQKGNDYQEWLIGGGANANLVSMDRNVVLTNPKTTDVVNKVVNPKQWLHMLRDLSEMSENATRIGMYKRAREKGVHQLEAAYEAREGTLDFSRIGSSRAIRAANALVPFLNVHLEGLDRAARAFRDDKIGFLTKIGAGITTPSVLLWFNNKDNERVQELPAWQRDLFWIVPTDKWVPMTADQRARFPDDLKGLENTIRRSGNGWERNAGTIYRIPKPFELGIIFGSIPERLLDAYFKDNPKAFNGLSKTMERAMVPNYVPQFALPFAEQWANRSLFLDRNLLTDAQLKLPPAQQYGPYTSETAKLLGTVVRGIAGEKSSFGSPIIVDNYIRQWTGGLGKHVTDIIDAGIKSQKDMPTEPTKSLADWPGYKAFVARFPDRGAQSIQDFYDQRNSRKMEQAGIKELSKTDPQGAAERMRSSSPYTGDPFAAVLKADRDAVTRITNDKNMSADDKRAAIDLTYLLMIEHAKKGVQSLERTNRKAQ